MDRAYYMSNQPMWRITGLKYDQHYFLDDIDNPYPIYCRVDGPHYNIDIELDYDSDEENEWEIIAPLPYVDPETEELKSLFLSRRFSSKHNAHEYVDKLMFTNIKKLNAKFFRQNYAWMNG
tara:strand:- start:5553 stop:5915 length:363 start_codon:yes stop_codon:yes gene_type:complete